jgi:hypothetical protein
MLIYINCKFTIRKVINNKDKNHKSSVLTISRSDIIRFGNYLYEDNFGLKRKYDKYLEIKNSYSGYEKISDELFKWIERTLNYYVSTKKMTPNESYKQLIDNIDYYYMMDEEDNNFLEFGEILKYSDVNKLSKDLSDLSSLDFNEVFYEI